MGLKISCDLYSGSSDIDPVSFGNQLVGDGNGGLAGKVTAAAITVGAATHSFGAVNIRAAKACIYDSFL